MHNIIFVTGAFGSGKTTIIRSIEKHGDLNMQFCYFDDTGVPSGEEMIEKFGSGEKWQEATTDIWVKKTVKEYLAQKETVLDGQIRLSFINDACASNSVIDYRIILFDCNNDVQKTPHRKRST